MAVAAALLVLVTPGATHAVADATVERLVLVMDTPTAFPWGTMLTS